MHAQARHARSCPPPPRAGDGRVGQPLTKRLVGVIMAALITTLSLAGPGPAAAQTYPERPVRIVVPFAPGGASDVLTRRIGEQLAERLKQPVVVENKAGGNTLIASEAVAKSAADGYTLYSTNTTLLQIPLLYPARYDALRDFAPVAQFALAPLALAVPTSSPAQDVAGLVEWLKARPGTTSYGTAGAGGTQHILSESFKLAAGVDSVHLPYKGESPLLTDFLGGRIDWYIATPITILPQVRAGKVRLLAVTGEQRFALAPEVPTFKELGYADQAMVGWYALFAPAGTPAPIIERLGREVAAIVRSPDVEAYLRENGLVPSGSGAQEFGPQLKPFQDGFARMIKASNIRVE